MPTIEAEPLVIAFKREVAKMRDRDAPDIEIKRCSSLLSSRSVGGRKKIVCRWSAP